jgi:hypothetical protein
MRAMFPLIPYKHIVIDTSLTKDKAKGIVSHALYGGKEFTGKVSENGFTLVRIIHYRNSFLPVLYGKFKMVDKLARIDIHMTLHPGVAIFALFWLGIVGYWLINSPVNWMGSRYNNGTWIFIGLVFFLYWMIFFAFGFEVKRSENAIRRLFLPKHPSDEPGN